MARVDTRANTTDNTRMENTHEIKTHIHTVLPVQHKDLSAGDAQRIYQMAFKAFETVIHMHGGECDVDTLEFNPVLKFPIGTKVFHKNVGRDEGTDWVTVPDHRQPGTPMRYQPNVAEVVDFQINEDGSIGYYTKWWNPQFTEHEWFPENELEAV